MHDVEVPRERAVLVGAPDKRLSEEVVREHLDELARLAETAGVDVVGTLTQRMDRPNPRTMIGEGKVEEVKALLAEAGATLAIFDDELSPAQGRNLETDLAMRVMDRAEIILDIFAVRARTAESRLQVELAQLQYMFPRLTRMWAHLSREKGGVGMHGPGETQLETDRRLVRLRIRDLREKLERVDRGRETRRQGRDGNTASVALVGYTNAGKSSLLKALSGADVFIEDRLFATLDSVTRTIDVGDGYSVHLTDTVGFIRKLPHHLVASFRSTLSEARDADLLLHVVDASRPEWQEQASVVDDVLADLDLAKKPIWLILNKMDRLTPEQALEVVAQATQFRSIPVIAVSARAQGGTTPLVEALLASARAERNVHELSVDVADGQALAAVYREGEVLVRTDVDEQVLLTVRLDPAAIGRLRRHASVHVSGEVQ